MHINRGLVTIQMFCPKPLGTGERGSYTFPINNVQWQYNQILLPFQSRKYNQKIYNLEANNLSIREMSCTTSTEPFSKTAEAK